MKQVLAALGILLLITACSTTKSGVDKRYEISVRGGEGDMTINLSLDATSATDTESGDAASTLTPKGAFGYQGGVGTLADEGSTQAQEGFESLFKQWMDNRKKDSENVTTTPAPVVVPPVVPPSNPADPVTGPLCSKDFDVEIAQTFQLNAETGLLLDSMWLEIDEWSSEPKTGDLLSKKDHNRVITFKTTAKAPCAGAEKATLWLELDKDEGLANGDKESAWVLRETESKQMVRIIEADADFHAKGFNKSNPRTPIDITEYIKKLFNQG